MLVSCGWLLTNGKHGRKRRIHKQKTKGKSKSSQGAFWFNCLSSQMKLLISGYWDEKSLFPPWLWIGNSPRPTFIISIARPTSASSPTGVERLWTLLMDFTFSLASRLLQLLFPQALCCKRWKESAIAKPIKLFGKLWGLSLILYLLPALSRASSSFQTNKSYRGEKSQGK